MRISDWSSDVCSSDLLLREPDRDREPSLALDERRGGPPADRRLDRVVHVADADGVASRGLTVDHEVVLRHARGLLHLDVAGTGEIGRASCRERVCQYV